ncbi:hypothetical protein PANDA_002934 [Ailuropoda melanoleuca]|uniref:Uncharacterized protein n=1 Tax=Ailuropoda melanoleuca TaxID=9646 RepID=D2H0I2_AILME|nr:hypothetical protein PANDA_002934 [Ailuropoda melanoleuca]
MYRGEVSDVKLLGKVACGDSELGLYETQQEEKSKPISRYPIPYEKDLPFDIVELTEEVEKKTGFLPNVFKVLSYRPLEFRAFFAYYNAIYTRKRQLRRADKELIIVVTSLANHTAWLSTVPSTGSPRRT